MALYFLSSYSSATGPTGHVRWPGVHGKGCEGGTPHTPQIPPSNLGGFEFGRSPCDPERGEAASKAPPRSGTSVPAHVSWGGARKQRATNPAIRARQPRDCTDRRVAPRPLRGPRRRPGRLTPHRSGSQPSGPGARTVERQNCPARVISTRRGDPLPGTQHTPVGCEVRDRTCSGMLGRARMAERHSQTQDARHTYTPCGTRNVQCAVESSSVVARSGKGATHNSP